MTNQAPLAGKLAYLHFILSNFRVSWRSFLRHRNDQEILRVSTTPPVAQH